ncbi:aldehyde dehydrogenase [Phaeocystidibacter marisrubri]|uniref:Aldehyde dehydrogenase n=1 Tax=Phaeocystidibacter marisrubri TaxID=1577780 RepID=A0A6L3ZFU4_9FLAO|nr:aldehyde dehydrogenase [Phaeocystidibacter marisrubri]KAB2816234.1 aldehyde dehydrogenase [Phaeocystidibacter marisrubri]GGH67985.1 2-hydroxymuconic semialdehyde dehydrogenase [Phaeocystidibacter marisrubri]
MDIQNFINGKYQDPIGDAWLENINPATGEVYGRIPDSDERDVELAVQAAQAAFPIWSSMSIQERSAILMKVSEGIEKRLPELAAAESKDNGKPLKLATRVDIPRARDNFAFFATAILHDSAETHDMGESGFNYTTRKPIGVAACISPWNLPLYLFTWKIAPALASGNTVVAKPSEVTPVTAALLGEICNEAGMPAGVLNIIHGLGGRVGTPLTEHPNVPVISFTGGTQTGAAIARIAAPKFKKLSLELGGKNPNIIFADCDFDDMLKTTVQSSFANQGQICLCGSRIFIERPIYEKFKQAFIEKVSKLKVGPPSEDSSQIGALVSEPHLNKVMSYIKLAEEEGGTILTGGERVKLDGEHANGYYLRPTVIEGLEYTCRTNQEEIFGPVVTLTPFDSEEEVLTMANSTTYGLAATIWTSNLKRAHRVASRVESGIIWVNCWLVRDLRTPFGGMKNSGVGREGGFEALHFFTETRNVCVKL